MSDVSFGQRTDFFAPETITPSCYVCGSHSLHSNTRSVGFTELPIDQIKHFEFVLTFDSRFGVNLIINLIDYLISLWRGI